MRNKSLPSKRSIITSYKIYQLVQTTLLQVIYQTYVKGSYKNQQTNVTSTTTQNNWARSKPVSCPPNSTKQYPPNTKGVFGHLALRAYSESRRVARLGCPTTSCWTSSVCMKDPRHDILDVHTWYVYKIC